MNNKITTLLFDLDGTLIDTNELIISSFLHTLEHYYPSQYTREDVLPFIGPTLHETFHALNPDLVDEMSARYRQYNWENHDQLVKEFAGVYETLELLAKKGFKLAIVTSKLRNIVLKGLKLTKLDSFFDVIVTPEDVKKPKPDPEAIYIALEKLGSTPEEALMVGDNFHDILGGKNAGTKTVGVSWSIKGRDFLAKYDPDYILDEMTDILAIVGVEKE